MKRRFIFVFLPFLSLFFIPFLLFAQPYPGQYFIDPSTDLGIFDQWPFGDNGNIVPIAGHSSSNCPDFPSDQYCATLLISPGYRAYREFSPTVSGQYIVMGASVYHPAGRSVCLRVRVGTTIYNTACTTTSGYSGLLWNCDEDYPINSPYYTFNVEPTTGGDNIYFDNYFVYSVSSCPVGSPLPTPGPSPTPGGCGPFLCTVEHVEPGGMCFNPSTNMTHTINLIRDSDFSSGIFPNTAWPYRPLDNYPFPAPFDYLTSQFGYAWDNTTNAPNLLLGSSFVPAYPDVHPLGFCQDITVRPDGLYGLSGVGDGRIVIWSPSPFYDPYPYQLMEYNLFNCGGDPSCFSDTATNFNASYITLCLQPYQGTQIFEYGDLMLVPVVQSTISNTVQYLPNCTELSEVEGNEPVLELTPLPHSTIPPFGTIPPPIVGTPTPYSPPIGITPYPTACYGWAGTNIEIKDVYSIPSLNVCVHPQLIDFSADYSLVSGLVSSFPLVLITLFGAVFITVIRNR